jgi:hypothetical protein
MKAGFVPIIFTVAALLTAGIAATQQGAPTSEMAAAANAFLETLTPEQKDAVMFPFDGEDRFDWHFIPRERKGVPLKTMNAPQQEAALNLVRTSLSEEGFEKSQTIRELEQILFEREGRDIRDRELYFFMIFGEPSSSRPWGWRYEGHHISQNWTVVNGNSLASSPQFLGTNPAHVREGRMTGTRVLASEEDQARALLGSLSMSLRHAAVISDEAPRDILTSNERRASMQENTGVSHGQLNGDQQGVLWSIIEEYARVQVPAVARERLTHIRAAGVENIRFAWMGSAAVGEGHYYRIQGPTFLIEFDNTQGDANHVHSVWRDFDGDFGRDLLSAHYAQYPHRLADD